MLNTFNDDTYHASKNMSQNKFDDRFVKDSFEGEKEQEYYKNATLHIGLRESEKIICQKYLDKNDAILDIGCGSGRTTFGLYELGYHDIVGLDLSDTMIDDAKKIAKEKGEEIRFVVGDAKKLDAPDNSYDAVLFSFNGLMMIPGQENRLQAMKEIKRVLKDKGYFIFTTHDRDIHSKERSPFRGEEKERWRSGLQDKDLLEYGDIKFPSKDEKEKFIHIPDQKEIASYLHDVGLSLVESPLRSEIARESEAVEEFAKECRFRIVQKNIK